MLVERGPTGGCGVAGERTRATSCGREFSEAKGRKTDSLETPDCDHVTEVLRLRREGSVGSGVWRGLPGQAEGGWPTVGKGGRVDAEGGAGPLEGSLQLQRSSSWCFHEPNRSAPSPRPRFPARPPQAAGFAGGSDCQESACKTGIMS